jgi:hypothetical protein
MAATEKQKANLRPPVKGEVRNPNGKPKGTLSAKTIIRKWLESQELIKNPLTQKNETVTILDSMTLALIAKARKGDVNAFNALLDRVEGKPKQQTEIDLNGNVHLSSQPITFE